MNFAEFLSAFHTDSIQEVLRTFPIRYDNVNPDPFCIAPKDGMRLVYKGTCTKIVRLTNRGNSLIRFSLTTQGHTISCLIINQPFYLNKLKNENDYLFVLYYSEARHVYVVSAIYSLDSLAAISGIKPVYSLPKGVTASYFTNYVRKYLFTPLGMLASPFNIIPEKYIKKYRLLDELTALKYIHFPCDGEELKQGLRFFKYEEALLYCTQALLTKAKVGSIKRRKILIDHNKINQFVKSLPYKLTADQNQAIREIVSDLEGDHVMFRLLQGDVGTGKTIVSFVVCYGNYLRGKQTLYVAPTYELAKQHFDNACKVFKDYGLRIFFLSGSSTAKEKNAISQKLKTGEIDLLISTHAAISKYVSFSDMGLVIIDEQQLFGVSQREQLLEKGRGADLLMMSATPIPRTLSQIVNSDMDVSLLSTFPSGQRNVKTELVRSTDPLIDKAIKKALSVKRQIFIVAPKIDESMKHGANVNAIYSEMVERYGLDNCQLLHGRIKKDEQDKIYQRFLSGEKPILVSTTIIEVGIDVSKAGLLIVYDANYFGLSTLHQLRGRIGRSGQFALALLVYDGNDEESISKLKFLTANSDGLEVAKYDMEHRGTGSYGGEKQSGRSELQVCNFVRDFNIFSCAKNDAMEIISAPDEPENMKFLDYLSTRKKALLV